MAVEQSTTEVPELPNTCGGVQKGVLHLDVECGLPFIPSALKSNDLAFQVDIPNYAHNT